MTDKSDYEQKWARRDVLSGVTAVTLLGGCAGTDSPKPESATTAPRTDSSSPTPTSSDTETTTPTSPDTETPTPDPTPATNRSAYPADQPTRVGSETDIFQQWLDYDEPLIADLNPRLIPENGAVRPVWSRRDWQRIVTRATEREDIDPFAYEFVDNTNFENKIIIIVQHVMIGGEWLRLLSVDGVGDSHLRLHAERAGRESANAHFYQYIILRVPTDGTEIERVTATVDDEQRSARYVYRDE